MMSDQTPSSDARLNEQEFLLQPSFVDSRDVSPLVVDAENPTVEEATGRTFRETVLQKALPLTALAFQQSPANEALRAVVTLEANQQSGRLVAAAAAGLITMAIEFGTSTLVAYGMDKGNIGAGIIKRYQQRKSAKEALKQAEAEAKGIDVTQEEKGRPRRARQIAADSVLALTFGPGIVVVKKHFNEESRTFAQDVKTGLRYSVLGSVVSAAAFGYGVTSITDVIDKNVPGKPIENSIDFITDPRTLAAGCVAGIGAFIASKIRRRKDMTEGRA